MTDQPVQDFPSRPVGPEVVHRTEDPSRPVACCACCHVDTASDQTRCATDGEARNQHSEPCPEHQAGGQSG